MYHVIYQCVHALYAMYAMYDMHAMHAVCARCARCARYAARYGMQCYTVRSICAMDVMRLV